MDPIIRYHDFPAHQYYSEETEKTQIVLHHTVSGSSVDGDIAWWKQTPSRVATCVIIARNGTINVLFPSEKWAHHLGVKIRVFDSLGIKRNYRRSVQTGKLYVANNVELNEGAIGVELDSWGGLTKKNGKYYHSYNKEVPEDKVIDYGRKIRGFRYYEKYTEAQIESLEYLLKYWNKKYFIPLDYKEEMWEESKKALKGEPGVWSHVSYRKDKSDLHPQEDLINMLKSLNHAEE